MDYFTSICYFPIVYLLSYSDLVYRNEITHYVRTIHSTVVLVLSPDTHKTHYEVVDEDHKVSFWVFIHVVLKFILGLHPFSLDLLFCIEIPKLSSGLGTSFECCEDLKLK